MGVGIIEPQLYRRRFIPDETVHLKNDVLLYSGDGMLVTKWDALKPRTDFARGYSVYLLREGWKVSWHLRVDGSLLRYYIDVVDTVHDASANTYVFNDLLVDVIILPDGAVQVLDVGELTEALDAGVIGIDEAKRALTRLDKLLAIVYAGKFAELTDPAMQYIQL